jgi:hypothetical protein
MKLEVFKYKINKIREDMYLNRHSNEQRGVCSYLDDVGRSKFWFYRYLSPDVNTHLERAGIDGLQGYWLGHRIPRNYEVRRTFLDMFEVMSISEKWYEEY